MLASPAPAHVTKAAGAFRVTIGWASEPPLTGLENSIVVEVTDADGAPVTDVRSPEVEVTFGDARVTLPLLPGEQPGEFEAALVPTRPGSYAIDVTAAADGEKIDVSSGCSEQSFECVEPASVAQFPVKDPSLGEIAERLSRDLPREQDAADTADSARAIALGALVLAAIALAVTIALVLRARRNH